MRRGRLYYSVPWQAAAAQRQREAALPQLFAHIVDIALRSTRRDGAQRVRREPQPHVNLRNGGLHGRRRRQKEPRGTALFQQRPRALLNTWLRLCVENPRLTFFLRVVMSQSRHRCSNFCRMSRCAPPRSGVSHVTAASSRSRDIGASVRICRSISGRHTRARVPRDTAAAADSAAQRSGLDAAPARPRCRQKSPRIRRPRETGGAPGGSQLQHSQGLVLPGWLIPCASIRPLLGAS